MVKSVTQSSFSSDVIEVSRKQPVVVDFWASWCQPCAMLAPILEQIEREYSGRVSFVKVDTDIEAQLASDYSVRSLPTVKLFMGGEAVAEFSGVMPPEEIRRFLDDRLPRSSDAVVEQARAEANCGNLEQGLRLLQEVLKLDPENYRIHPEAASLLIDLRRLDEAEAMIKLVPANLEQEEPFSNLAARIRLARLAGNESNMEMLREKLAADPQDLKTRLQLAACEALAGDHEASMDNLLQIIRQDRNFEDDAGRKALLDVFSMLENRGSLVRKYRGLLSSALN